MSAVTTLLACALLGQPTSDERELKEALLPLYRQQAEAYRFALDADGKQPLELAAEPLLTWTNADRYMGAVFLWTRDGRPEVIGCIGSNRLEDGRQNVFHEFQTLTVAPLPPVDIGSGIRRWAAEKPGVDLQPVPGALAPAANERLRLTQMRALARDFHTWMKDGEDVSELRLLSQPLHRYSSPAQGVTDGAIFSYVWTKGTDPEVLLILEARSGTSGPEWQYSLGRFNWRELWATHDDHEVWRVAETKEFWESQVLRENYTTGVIGPFAVETLPSSGR
jgi:hypothetical protein